jgi:hypothetical protein
MLTIAKLATNGRRVHVTIRPVNTVLIDHQLRKKQMTEKKLEDKTIDKLTTEDFPKIKVVIAPGAFDSFEGSQEELDEMMQQIHAMIADGSLFEKSRAVDIDELLESDDPEDREMAEKLLQSLDDQAPPRMLQ